MLFTWGLSIILTLKDRAYELSTCLWGEKPAFIKRKTKPNAHINWKSECCLVTRSEAHITHNFQFPCCNNGHMHDTDDKLHGSHCAFQADCSLEINGLSFWGFFPCMLYKVNYVSLSNSHKYNCNTKTADSLVGDFSSGSQGWTHWTALDLVPREQNWTSLAGAL